MACPHSSTVLRSGRTACGSMRRQACRHSCHRSLRLRCASQAGQGGRGKPEWLSILEDDVDKDPDVAELLRGTGGDPDKVRDKMKQRLMQGSVMGAAEGVDKLPRVEFRELNYFRCWVWLEFYATVTQQDLELLDALIRSWFLIGKLGGYNSQNLQVSMNCEDDQSYFKYDLADAEDAMGSYFHDMGQLEMRQSTMRFWVDMGTCDELAVDVLLNTLFGFSKEYVGIKSIFVGGDNSDWPAPDINDDALASDLPDFSSMGRMYDNDEDDEVLDEELDELDSQAAAQSQSGGSR